MVMDILLKAYVNMNVEFDDILLYYKVFRILPEKIYLYVNAHDDAHFVSIVADIVNKRQPFYNDATGNQKRIYYKVGSHIVIFAWNGTPTIQSRI